VTIQNRVWKETRSKTIIDKVWDGNFKQGKHSNAPLAAEKLRTI
jgi:hypothetical protein